MSLTTKLKKNVADLAVLFVKLHDLHWHVQGLSFKTFHEMTEAYYDQVADMFDDVAERLVQKGEVSPASLAEYVKLAEIKELGNNKSYNVKELLSYVKGDFEYLLKSYKDILSLSEKEGDVVTADLVTGNISYLEKQLWMIEASSK